jgi:hypothetical protein
LQHTFDLSDEEVVWGWVENPYWQVFTGETYLQTKPPIDPSSLSRWRKRLGEAGVEELLAQSIEAAKRASVIKPASIKRVIVDTTVMAKATAPPTDSALLEKSRVLLVKALLATDVSDPRKLPGRNNKAYGNPLKATESHPANISRRRRMSTGFTKW